MNETDIQRAVFRHFRQRGAPNVFAFHPANGGYRRHTEAAILKGIGVTNGVPDIIAVKDGKPFALELKTETGKLSMAQVNAHSAMRAAGFTVATTHGLDEAIRQIEEWGLVRGVAA